MLVDDVVKAIQDAIEYEHDCGVFMSSYINSDKQVVDIYLTAASFTLDEGETREEVERVIRTKEFRDKLQSRTKLELTEIQIKVVSEHRSSIIIASTVSVIHKQTSLKCIL